MRKKMFIYIFFMGTICLSAQNNINNGIDTIQTEIVSESQNKITEEKLQEALQTIEEQKKLLLELRNVEIKLETALKEKDILEEKSLAAEKHAESIEKSLISMASNFLYIPYEAYGVEKIAIKAFESIQNQKLIQDYYQRYVLLVNYQRHLREFRAYLERVQKACNGIFQSTATEFIDSDDSDSQELVLRKQPFYLEYVKYEEYNDTYIGNLIQKTETILKAHTRQNRANLKEVIDVIDETLSPAEINTLEEGIKTIDEQLKTIEGL